MKATNDKLLILYEPTNYMEEIFNIDFFKWFEAMKSKMVYDDVLISKVFRNKTCMVR